VSVTVTQLAFHTVTVAVFRACHELDTARNTANSCAQLFLEIARKLGEMNLPERAIRHVSGRLLIASCTACFLALAVVLMVTLEVAPGSLPGVALITNPQNSNSLLVSLERARPAKEASHALSWLASEEQRLAVEDPARAEAKATLTPGQSVEKRLLQAESLTEKFKAESAQDLATPSKVEVDVEAAKELAKTSKVARAKPSKAAEAAKDWTRAVDFDDSETHQLEEKQMQERVDHAKALLKEEVAAAKAKAQSALAKAQATLSASAQEQRPATAQEDRNDLTLRDAPPSLIVHEEAALQGDRLQVEVQGINAYVCANLSSFLCYES
jgi:hypothetical protein